MSEAFLLNKLIIPIQRIAIEAIYRLAVAPEQTKRTTISSKNKKASHARVRIYVHSVYLAVSFAFIVIFIIVPYLHGIIISIIYVLLWNSE